MNTVQKRTGDNTNIVDFKQHVDRIATDLFINFKPNSGAFHQGEQLPLENAVRLALRIIDEVDKQVDAQLEQTGNEVMQEVRSRG